MMGGRNRLSAKSRRVVAAMLTSRTLSEAAATLGMNLDSLRLKLQDHPEIREEYELAAVEAVNRAMSQLALASECAAAVLCNAVREGKAPTKDMIRVCEVILERSDAYVLQRSLRAEIDELRAMLNERREVETTGSRRGDVEATASSAPATPDDPTV